MAKAKEAAKDRPEEKPARKRRVRSDAAPKR
jgi:hypothetical protein